MKPKATLNGVSYVQTEVNSRLISDLGHSLTWICTQSITSTRRRGPEPFAYKQRIGESDIPHRRLRTLFQRVGDWLGWHTTQRFGAFETLTNAMRF